MQAVLEPRAFDGHLEVLEPDLQQLVVGQRGPGKFLARHGARNPERARSKMVSHGRTDPTTGK